MFSQNTLYLNDIHTIVSTDFPWERLSNSSILISGASGMIGTVLVDVLMERNRLYHENISVYAMGRTFEKAQIRFKDYLDDHFFHTLICDVNTCSSLEEHFDYIFHCASNTHPRAYASDPIGTIMTNVLGTEQILKLAVKSKSRRVLFLSSVEVYGENRGDVEQFDEGYCGYINCNTLRAGYPEGKRTGEALCQAYIKSHQLDVVIPRISRVFGPTMLPSDSKALSQFIKKAVSNEDIVLKSEGTQYYSYTYAPDAVSALFYLLFFGSNGEAYNIADTNFDIQLKNLANILANIAHRKVVFELPDALEASGYSKATVARLDPTKISRLGWKPQNTLAEALEKTVTILKG